MFSKTFGYALRAVTYVAAYSKGGKKISLQELSERLDIPHHFLGKVMQDMVRHHIIDSAKGPSGGFFAHEETEGIILLEVLKITDGNMVFDTCALGIKRCNSANPCPLHHDFAACRNGMLHTFSIKTIGMLASEVIAGEAFLVR